MKFLKKLGNIGREFKLLLIATLFFGTAGGIFQATLNNYLSDVHSLDAMARGWLEFPRELPGFLIIGVSALMLSFLRESRIASVALLLSCIGALGLGFIADDTTTLIIFIIIWSLGDHIIFAVEGPLGLHIAKRGGEGRRLGQLGGARNVGVILGVGAVWLLAKVTGPRYDLFYAIAGGAALLSGISYFRLKIGQATTPSRRFVFKKK
ncbi:hypothetical protein HN843_02260, partial [bacterium]|nr:hypothetical protein [bacterium]